MIQHSHILQVLIEWEAYHLVEHLAEKHQQDQLQVGKYQAEKHQQDQHLVVKYKVKTKFWFTLIKNAL